MFQDWYDIKEKNNISQGDILFNVPIYLPEYPDTPIQEENVPINCPGYEMDGVVLTQACDLEIRPGSDCPKTQSVLIAALTNARSDKTSKSTLIEISTLRRTNLFLLEACSGELSIDYQIVHFDMLYTIPWIYLNNYCTSCGKHLRLKSPYMELLSHHFGNYFSRVAIPEDRSPIIRSYCEKQEQYIKKFGEERWHNSSIDGITQFLNLS